MVKPHTTHITWTSMVKQHTKTHHMEVNGEATHNTHHMEVNGEATHEDTSHGNQW